MDAYRCKLSKGLQVSLEPPEMAVNMAVVITVPTFP
jgi:hypothetical protein